MRASELSWWINQCRFHRWSGHFWSLWQVVVLVNHMACRNNSWYTMTSQLLNFTNLILIFEITCLISLEAKRTSFSTERTTVCFLYYTSKLQFCLLLWTLRGSFKNFWFLSTVPGTQVQVTVSASQWGTKAKPLQRYSTCSKFSPTVHWHVYVRSLTCQWSTK